MVLRWWWVDTLTKISFNNVLPNHSIIAPLYRNAFGIRCKQQTRFAADPQGDRNLWRYRENFKKKVGRQTGRQALAIGWSKGGMEGKGSDPNEKILREREVWAARASWKPSACRSSCVKDLSVEEVAPAPLFGLIWGLRDSAPREGSTFTVRPVISD